MTLDTPHSTQPSRKRMRIAIVGLGVTIGLLIYAGLNYFGPSISSGTLNQLASRIPISPETTIYTSPIDEHGFVNFNEAFYDASLRKTTPLMALSVHLVDGEIQDS